MVGFLSCKKIARPGPTLPAGATWTQLPHEDLVSMKTHPDLTNLLPLEVHEAKVYARNVFEGFMKLEFKQIIFCWHEKLQKKGDITVYEVYYEFNQCVCYHNVEVNHIDM